MNTLIAAVVLVAAVAAPAHAQTAARRAPVQGLSQSDQSLGRGDAQRHAPRSGNSVYSGNELVGADPDPNVRMNLRIDYEQRM
jgi:hypothetical protein